MLSRLLSAQRQTSFKLVRYSAHVVPISNNCIFQKGLSLPVGVPVGVPVGLRPFSSKSDEDSHVGSNNFLASSANDLISDELEEDYDSAGEKAIVNDEQGIDEEDPFFYGSSEDVDSFDINILDELDQIKGVTKEEEVYINIFDIDF